MRWQVTARSGENDAYAAQQAADEGRLVVEFDVPASPRRMRESVIERITQVLGRPPGTMARDLLTVAMTVYAADLSIPRRLAEDGWTREIHVHAPVTEPDRWEAARAVLERLLRYLSGDEWTFSFRGRVAVDTPSEAADDGEAPPFDTTCLFSGGLDSLVGATDLLAGGRRTLLVGHYGGGTTSKFQQEVYDGLKRVHKDATRALRFQVLPPQLPRHKSGPAEDTQRARSFLFFGLGVAAADAVGVRVPLYVPENGLISLNVPLTGARSGSASTRTTHPHYVRCYRELLAALELDHPLVLPYRFKTKAEMLREGADQALLAELTPLTISCAHPDQRRWSGGSGGGHCGHCFPCLIRRATVAAAGMPDADYDLDVLTHPPDPSDKTGRDLRAVQIALARLARLSDRRLPMEVHKSGPIEPGEIGEFTDVYRRGMRELQDFLE